MRLPTLAAAVSAAFLAGCLFPEEESPSPNNNTTTHDSCGDFRYGTLQGLVSGGTANITFTGSSNVESPGFAGGNFFGAAYRGGVIGFSMGNVNGAECPYFEVNLRGAFEVGAVFSIYRSNLPNAGEGWAMMYEEMGCGDNVYRTWTPPDGGGGTVTIADINGESVTFSLNMTLAHNENLSDNSQGSFTITGDITYDHFCVETP